MKKYRGVKDDVQYLRLGNEHKVISGMVFEDFWDLKKVVLNQELETIHSQVFLYCGLEELQYAGTLEQWSKIKKASDWAEGADIVVVKCTDGDAPVEKLPT